MDKHLHQLPAIRGRILETVWYLSYSGTATQLRDYVQRLLGPEDRLIVVEAKALAWQNLLVSNAALKQAWEAN